MKNWNYYSLACNIKWNCHRTVIDLKSISLQKSLPKMPSDGMLKLFGTTWKICDIEKFGKCNLVTTVPKVLITDGVIPDMAIVFCLSICILSFTQESFKTETSAWESTKNEFCMHDAEHFNFTKSE